MAAGAARTRIVFEEKSGKACVEMHGLFLWVGGGVRAA